MGLTNTKLLQNVNVALVDDDGKTYTLTFEFPLERVVITDKHIDYLQEYVFLLIASITKRQCKKNAKISNLHYIVYMNKDRRDTFDIFITLTGKYVSEMIPLLLKSQTGEQKVIFRQIETNVKFSFLESGESRVSKLTNMRRTVSKKIALARSVLKTLVAVIDQYGNFGSLAQSLIKN